MKHMTRIKPKSRLRMRYKGYRFDARLNGDQKQLIQRAADMEGRSMTDFVIESAQAAAKRTLEDRTTLVLRTYPRNGATFYVAALLNRKRQAGFCAAPPTATGKP